jgi:hypothetical protein
MYRLHRLIEWYPEEEDYIAKVKNISRWCNVNNSEFYNTKSSDLKTHLNGSPILFKLKKHDVLNWERFILKYCNYNIPYIPNSLESMIDIKVLFSGRIPIFMFKNISFNYWLSIKHNYENISLICPPHALTCIYRDHGYKYIQISEKGLYHLGDDIYNFGVPKFLCPQRIYFETNVIRYTDDICKVVPIISCRPTNITKLISSNFSLDSIKTLPQSIKYIPRIIKL